MHQKRKERRVNNYVEKVSSLIEPYIENAAAALNKVKSARRRKDHGAEQKHMQILDVQGSSIKQIELSFGRKHAEDLCCGYSVPVPCPATAVRRVIC